MGDYWERTQWARLCAILAAVAVMETLLRSDTIALWNRLRSMTVSNPHWNWLRLALATVPMVLLVEIAAIASYGRFPAVPGVMSLLLNSVVLFSLAGILFAITNRFAFTVVLTYSVYLLALVANVLKVEYLQTTIRPLDVHYLAAFQEFSTYFFGKTIIVGACVAGVLWAVAMAFLWRKSKYRVAWLKRIWIGTASTAVFLGLMFCDKCSTIAYAFECVNVKKNLSYGMCYAERRGFLFDFISDIPDSFARSPENYSKPEIDRIVREHCTASNEPAAIVPSPCDVNVVFYLIESLMDPADLRVRLTSDPIPFFHAAARENTSGHIIVPNQFCGSTNTEFEILTGMSCAFLPRGACPYVQYVKRDIPTVPMFFQEQGYATFTAHAGQPHLYDRVRVYQHMHVGSTIWLTERTKKEMGWKENIRNVCPTNVDIAGRCPTDQSLVDAVIEVSKSHPRYFMYASANSTHAPYDYTGYLASDLDICDPMSPKARDELKTYLNALRTSDRALGKMLDYFRGVPQKTIVIVIGDHWPPFSNSREIYAASGCLEPEDGSRFPTSRRVPLLVWSNFLKKGPDLDCSPNFLATEVLSRIGLRPSGFLALNDALRLKLAVLSNNCVRTQDGEFLMGGASGSLGRLIADYGLLQHDVLRGEQFSKP